MLNPDVLRSMEHFEDLLSGALQQAITTVRDILAGEEAQVSTVLLTVCGVWKTGNSQQPCVILPWSPFFNARPLTVSDGLVSAAKIWMTARFSKSISALHDISKHLWKSASPLRCAQFLNGRQIGIHYAPYANFDQDVAPVAEVASGCINMLPRTIVQRR